MPDLTTEKFSVLKEINRSDITFEETVVYATQNLNTGSKGIQSISYVSGSISNNYWQSLHNLFYLSGSPIMSASDPYTYDLVSSPNYSMGLNNIYNPQHRHKFHGYPSGSIITIPQRYFGEEIKPGSFKITDTQNSKDVIIVDDKYGNLYSTNAEHSQSAGALSSSDNYVGNIFYDTGLAVITETGSWSGSINYPQVTSASNFNLEFKSTQTIYTREYNIKIDPNDFNYTLNTTARCFLSGSTSNGTDISDVIGNPYMCAEFTGSEWQPYITTILFHRKINEEPLFIAKLPKPLRKSDRINMNIKVRLDM